MEVDDVAPQNGEAAEKPIACIIDLEDNTELIIRDTELVNSCKVLVSCFENCGGNDGSKNRMAIKSFSPGLVRLVFENMHVFNIFMDEKKDFTKSDLYFTLRTWNKDDLLKMAELGNYLDCPSVVKGATKVVADKLAQLSVGEICAALGLERDIGEAESRALRDKYNWYKPRP